MLFQLPFMLIKLFLMLLWLPFKILLEATSPAASSPTPAGCYPIAASGNCYEPGEFCPDADAGVTGVAGDGKRIICEDNNGLRWEPA